MKRTVLFLCILALLCAGMEAGAKRVRPREIQDLLANPGMGWQTFHCFADEDRTLEGLPSGSAYFRFYWKELEPAEGQIDFAKIDALLARARKAGQKLAFRIMCAGTDEDSLYVPQWLKDKGCPGFQYRYENKADYWVPDMDSPVFQEAHFRTLRALGRRYDGHPDLDLVDIGTVGLWGEWHMSGTGVEVPSLKTRLAIIDTYLKAFPGTLKAMLIGDVEGMKAATRRGAGWRADCLGDMGGFSRSWNHMASLYPQQIRETGASDAWKRGPVAWESCWDMRKWKAEGWDIPYIFDYALDYHASYMNNKSAPVPEGGRPDVERFLKKLGYRLVLRSLEHPDRAAPGNLLPLKMVWENVGVAPPYRDWRLAIRLASASRVWVKMTDISIRGWLPESRTLTAAIRLPATLRPGRYDLALAVVDPRTKAPAVRLAVAGRGPDGWYPLSRLEVAAGKR
ncbi:MAG: DUF4832 domain-containing protein [Armatimonadetes bacterium]|nr:DUF4832 domain-containing protein [Armatimonadota bacterium]